MKQTLTAAGTLALVMALHAPGNCEETRVLQIQHTTAPCAMAGRYPRIEARIEPTAQVRTARVLFHAAHSPSWYAVEMRALGGGVWSAALPRVKEEAMRIGYFIVAEGPDARGRFPTTGALITEVTPLCGVEGLPTASRGPETLGLLGAADPDVPSFDLSGVTGFVEGIEEETPESRSSRRLSLAVAPLERVRLTTVAPAAGGKRVREDGRSVTFQPNGDGAPMTLAKAGHTLEGRLDAAEDGVVVLSLKGAGKVRIRQEDVVRIEVRKEGSSAMAVVGGLAGAGAGFFTSILVCASGDLCHSIAPLWVGTALGAGVGAAAAGAGEWQQVPFERERHVALALAPARRGFAAAVRLSF